MKSLADEILEHLPEMFDATALGPTVADVCSRLDIGPAHARAAMKRLDEEGRALFVRYEGSKRRHLLPLDALEHPAAACAYCRLVFERPPKSKRVCCTKACGIRWSWTNPSSRANRTAAIQRSAGTAEFSAKAVERNRIRWSDPAQRASLSEKNRLMWADPAVRARRSAAIQAVQGTPENRQKAARRKREQWADPDYRERHIEALRSAKRSPEARAKFSELLKARWQDPEMRAKFMAANAARAAANAERNRGRKQSPETIRKRVDSTRRTRAAKRAEREA